MGNRQNMVKQLGRLQYIEPTNLFTSEEGTLSDKINFPYEDYCMAVDLIISQTSRYSCGWWKESGELNEITYSSKNGTLSFLGGSDIGGGEGYFTTNFTDVNMINPENNSAECLGISSINISYDKAWFPQVVIKFVDIRGGTMFLPAEQGYYDSDKISTTSAIYKAFFSLPYPMFTLKVKGFYGKGVTYKLALYNTSFDFDSNTGNFNIVANFIGHKYGIYGDMPISFIGCAPFMDGGKEYWDSKIKSGEFRFRTREGLPGGPMLTIPELKYKLALASNNHELFKYYVDEEESLSNLDTKINALEALIASYPLKDWYNNEVEVLTKDDGYSNYKYCYEVRPNTTSIKNFFSEIEEYVGIIEEYDKQFNENLTSKVVILRPSKSNATIEDYIEYGKRTNSKGERMFMFFVMCGDDEIRYETKYDVDVKFQGASDVCELMADGFLWGMNGISNLTNDTVGNNDRVTKMLDYTTKNGNKEDTRFEYSYFEQEEYVENLDEYIELQGKLSDNERMCHKVRKWAKERADSLYKDVWPKFYYVLAYRKDGIIKTKEFYDYYQKTLKEAKAERERITQEYRRKTEEKIEKLLGFRPTIKNIYDLMFAHMDTFMHTFYSSTKIIKDQLDGITDKTARAKTTHNIKDYFTDTENVRIKNSNGIERENTNERSKYLPPYAAYYTEENNGITCAKKLMWLEDVEKGELLEEVNFIDNLTNGCRTYFKKVEEIEHLIEQMNAAGEGEYGIDMTFTDADTPIPSVADFIPLTTFDFMFKGKYGNPYSEIPNIIERGRDELKHNIYFIFATRALQYLHLNRFEQWTTFNELENTARAFGAFEAINLFKAVGDNFSNSYITFLDEICQDGDEEEFSNENDVIDSFMDAITSENSFLNNSNNNLNTSLFKYFNYSIDSKHELEADDVLNGDVDILTTKFDIENDLTVTYTTTKHVRALQYNYHKGYELTESEAKKYGGSDSINYVMLPFFTTGIKDAQKKYTQGGDVFNDQTIAPDKLYCNLYKTNDIDVTTFVMFKSRDYLENIYKAVEYEIENSLSYIQSTTGTYYGNRKPWDFNGMYEDTTLFLSYVNNMRSENVLYGQHLGTSFITDAPDNDWFYTNGAFATNGYITTHNADTLVESSYDIIDESDIKFTTFDYTFDSKNPGSIFNNSIYWDQGDNIKAKACLFLMAIPTQGGGVLGMVKNNDNGKVYKSLLLKEGAIYWYIDTFGTNEGIKYPEYVYKMYTDSNNKLVKNEWHKIKCPTFSSWRDFPLYDMTSYFNDYLCVDFENYYGFSLSYDKPTQLNNFINGWSPSRRKVLKKFFEEWAEGDFKSNESELTTLKYYSRDFTSKYEKILIHGLTDSAINKDGIPRWHYFGEAENFVAKHDEIGYKFSKGADATQVSYDDVRFIHKRDTNGDGFLDTFEPHNYDNGLDVIIEKRLYPNDDIAKGLTKLMEFVNDTFFSVYTVFELYATWDNTYGYGKKSPVTALPSNWKDLFNTDSYTIKIMAEEGLMKEAFRGFRRQLYQTYHTMLNDYKDRDKNNAFKENVSNFKEASNSFKSKDLKLATYMTLKHLYDKWLCFPHNGAKDTWVLKRDNENSRGFKKGSSEFDNFIYVDSFFNDIGNNLLININETSKWLSSVVPNTDINSEVGLMTYTGRTLFNFFETVAQYVGGNLFSAPQSFSLTNTKSVGEMFTPMPLYSDWDDDTNGFVFMYTYQPSQLLGDNSTSTVDMNGWSPEGDGLDLSDDEIVARVLGNNDKSYNIPAFGVTYAKQNQSIFKNVRLSTTTQAVTEASISALMSITSKAAEGPREVPLFGQDLYRVYSNYSYHCSVETMGNMQITPMMYFQLNNIPFWKGAYQIIRVQHNIVPGNITTIFEGVRVNRHAIPLTDGAVILMPEESGSDTSSSNNSDRLASDSNVNEITTSEPLGNGRQSIPDNSTTYLTAVESSLVADTSGTHGGPVKYYHHGLIELQDCDANPNAPLNFTPQFDESNISEKKPVIYIHPAHSYNNKSKGCVEGATGEHCWSVSVVDKICEILKTYQFSDGTSYSKNVQKGRTDNNSYGGKEAYELVAKYGSKKVITIVPHWNGGGGKYWCGIMNGREQSTRLDSVKLMEAIAFEAECVKNNSSSYSNMPKGMMDGGVSVRHYFDGYDKNTGKTSPRQSEDCGTIPNCAAALTENWFADYDNWKGRDWLKSPEGINIIAEMHAKGIKRYIDSL